MPARAPDEAHLNDLLEPPRFRLSLAADAPGGLAQVDWRIRSFTADEGLSRPYVLEIEVIAGAVDIDPEALLGVDAALHLERENQRRTFAGLILGVERAARGHSEVGLRLTIGPALALLEHRQDRRIWTGKTVIEVVSSVIDGPLAAHGRRARWDLEPTDYGTREHWVQHGESDLDFIHRLLAAEGIHYRFEIEERRGQAVEVVVFSDASPRSPVITLGRGDSERRGRGALPFLADGLGSTGEEALRDFSWRRRLGPTASHLRTWRWEAAAEPPEDAEIAEITNLSDLAEIAKNKLTSCGLTIHETCADAPDAAPDELRRLRARHQRRALASASGHGSADAVDLAAGRRFGVLGHPDPACDRGYLVTRARHHGDAPEAQLHAAASGAQPRYRCDFECIADDAHYRPSPPSQVRPPLETAIVVGPAGEEIHTDAHGRILVRFPWDRRDSDPEGGGEAATAWLRVRQAWAGSGFGSLFLPRVGHEVVVDYLGGDPDRPVVVGCLYNSLHPPPFPLPEEKTTSGLRSDSTPGGGGYHEIAFNDTKGQETLRIRAQRDLQETVLRDQTTTIGRHREVSIGGCDTRTVAEEEVLSVTGGSTHWIGNGYTMTVANEGLKTTVENGGLTTTVEKGDLHTNLREGNIRTIVNKGWLQSVIADAHSLSAKSQGIRIEENARLSVGTEYEISVRKGDLKADASDGNILLRAKGSAPNGVFSAIADRHGQIQVLDGDLTISAEAVRVHKSKTIHLDASEGITLKCGSSKIELTPRGIILTSINIKSEALDVQKISGNLILLN